MNLAPLKIILQLDNIPVYDGVKELLDKGFESTLSPANEIFLKNTKGDDLISKGWEPGPEIGKEIKRQRMKLIDENIAF